MKKNRRTNNPIEPPDRRPGTINPVNDPKYGTNNPVERSRRLHRITLKKKLEHEREH
jgi:hypothetical protein